MTMSQQGLGSKRFPVGGPRQAVYDYLRDHGYIISKWSDKHWARADGISLHVYGSGSMARINGKGHSTDAALDAAVKIAETWSA